MIRTSNGSGERNVGAHAAPEEAETVETGVQVNRSVTCTYSTEALKPELNVGRQWTIKMGTVGVVVR
jgi:hypothetical protein